MSDAGVGDGSSPDSGVGQTWVQILALLLLCFTVSGRFIRLFALSLLTCQRGRSSSLVGL